MFPTKKIFSIPFVSATWEQVRQHIAALIARNGKELWITANPEIIERSYIDQELMSIVRDTAVVFPDGVGVLWAARMSGYPLPERLSGIDMIPLFKGLSLYLLGAKASVVSKTADVLKGQGHIVAGSFHGYFDEIEERHILEEIKRLRPQVLLVGLGMGRQEKWLAAHIEELPINIGLTVGGSFDVISGIKKRAPLIVRKARLEWLYRLVHEPMRIMRQMVLVKFVLRVFLHTFLFAKKDQW